MDNSGKIILDLCGGTGAWSRPYKDAGYDVMVITLPEHDVGRVEFGDHAMRFERMDVHYMETDTVIYKDVYGILAAPPCTEFSVAKGNCPRDFAGAMEIVKACLEIIWQCRIRGSLKFWALENPRGYLRQFLGVPNTTIEQWEYGGNKRKATDIWGYFKEPTPTVKVMPDDMQSGKQHDRGHARDWSRMECPQEYVDYISQFRGDAKRAALRAITPPGFAQAFYRANK